MRPARRLAAARAGTRGEYSTGAIHLKSNVNLNVAKGATSQIQSGPKEYLPLVFTRWEGMELMNYSPLIYALRKRMWRSLVKA